MGLQTIVDLITFPAPRSSYSPVSHLEDLLFIEDPEIPDVPIPCMWVSAKSPRPNFVVVHCHANGCDIGDMVQAMRQISSSLRAHSFLVEYPGYGLHDGTSNCQTISRTMKVIHDFLTEKLKIPPERIIWYGRSIGSGSAIELASITKEKYGADRIGGVVVQCGFANFKDVAGFLFGKIAKALVKNPWRNEEKIASLDCPILILHGKKDTMIPIAQAEKLWAAVPNKFDSAFHACSCGHNDFNFPVCTLPPMASFFHTILQRRFDGAPLAQRITPPENLIPKLLHIEQLRHRIPQHQLRRTSVDELENPQYYGSPKKKDKKDKKKRNGSAGSTASNKSKASSTKSSSKKRSSSKRKKQYKKFCQCHGANTNNNSDDDLECEVCLDSVCPFFKGKSELQLIPDLLCNVRTLMHFLTLRMKSFLNILRERLETLDGEVIDEMTLVDLVDIVQCEFWLRSPFPVLFEEIPLPKGRRKTTAAIHSTHNETQTEDHPSCQEKTFKQVRRFGFGPFKIIEDVEDENVGDVMSPECHRDTSNVNNEIYENMKMTNDNANNILEKNMTSVSPTTQNREGGTTGIKVGTTGASSSSTAPSPKGSKETSYINSTNPAKIVTSPEMMAKNNFSYCIGDPYKGETIYDPIHAETKYTVKPRNPTLFNNRFRHHSNFGSTNSDSLSDDDGLNLDCASFEDKYLNPDTNSDSTNPTASKNNTKTSCDENFVYEEDVERTKKYAAAEKAFLGNPNVLRVPIWGWAPSTAQFRYVAEWAVLTSDTLCAKLGKKLEENENSKNNDSYAAGGGGFTEAHGDTGRRGRSKTSKSPRKKRKKKKTMREPPPILDLSATLAGQYIHWLRGKTARRVIEVFVAGPSMVSELVMERASMFAGSAQCSVGRSNASEFSLDQAREAKMEKQKERLRKKSARARSVDTITKELDALVNKSTDSSFARNTRAFASSSSTSQTNTGPQASQNTSVTNTNSTSNAKSIQPSDIEYLFRENASENSSDKGLGNINGNSSESKYQVDDNDTINNPSIVPNQSSENLGSIDMTRQRSEREGQDKIPDKVFGKHKDSVGFVSLRNSWDPESGLEFGENGENVQTTSTSESENDNNNKKKFMKSIGDASMKGVCFDEADEVIDIQSQETGVNSQVQMAKVSTIDSTVTEGLNHDVGSVNFNSVSFARVNLPGQRESPNSSTLRNSVNPSEFQRPKSPAAEGVVRRRNSAPAASIDHEHMADMMENKEVHFEFDEDNLVGNRQSMDVGGGMTGYTRALTRVREAVMQSDDHATATLNEFLSEAHPEIPELDQILEAIMHQHESAVFSNDYFAAVLLKHAAYSSTLPLSITELDHTQSVMRKYLHFFMLTLFRPESMYQRKMPGFL